MTKSSACSVGELFIAAVIFLLPLMTDAQEEADCSPEALGPYSIAAHVAGIFIVMVSSGVGIFTTLAIGTQTANRRSMQFLQVTKMFGIGVIAATGWCHLIPEAFEAFSNPCLAGAWADYGPPFVGVIALVASFAVQLIELVVSTQLAHSQDEVAAPPVEPSEDGQVHPVPAPPVDPISIGHGSELLQLESEIHEQGNYLRTIILEAGILFHSLVIGLTLGVTTSENTYRTLLIAICFHQFFEGLALGTLISRLEYHVAIKFVFMGLLYPLTTPIGMAIGIGIHEHYNSNSMASILTDGIFNSLSAGILLYNTYAELLATEVNHNITFRQFKPGYKAVNLGALYIGAAAMAVLAKWA